jgi:hypothetical protein
MSLNFLQRYVRLANFIAVKFQIMICRKRRSGTRGSIVVEAQSNKLESRGLETPWNELIFLIYVILPAELDPGVYSASSKNEYRKQKNNVYGE